jgi:uncharacterized UBP type Zn finger protein
MDGQACVHLSEVQDVGPRTPEGCDECLQTGSWWVHLRLCLSCGPVGCRDNSPNKHATKHYGHNIHSFSRSGRAKIGVGATSTRSSSSQRLCRKPDDD